jgi:hypothetical protein
LKTGWRKSTLSVIQRKNPTVKRKFTIVKLWVSDFTRVRYDR